MKSKFAFILFLIIVFSLFVISGCCRKPPKEVADAEAAVNKAKEKCGEQYAPEEYKKAMETLKEAQDLGEQKKCKKSKAAALDAIRLASEVEKKAADVQAKAKVDAQAALKKAEEAISVAEKARADEYAKDQLTEAKDLLKKAQDAFDSDECAYLEVSDIANKATAKAGEAKMAAEAEIKRIEEQKRAEEEARRRAEEEALRAKPRNWVVQKGECLWKIAEYEKIYSDPFQWPLIYQANKDQIKDPDLIYPDQNFAIPRDMTQEEIADAIKFAKNRPWPVPNYLFDGK
jgi:hypothetical protein